MPIEGRRWIVGLIGYDDHRPGHTAEDFLERCESLPAVFRSAVSGGLIDDIKCFSLGDSRRRRPGRPYDYPVGLISVGDAVASFNPTHAQGITCAALHASALSEHLNGWRNPVSSPRRLFTGLRVVTDVAWATVEAAETARLGEPSPAGIWSRFQRWRGQQVNTAARHDPGIAAAVGSVGAMVLHPGVLSRPGIVLRSLRINRSTVADSPKKLHPSTKSSLR